MKTLLRTVLLALALCGCGPEETRFYATCSTYFVGTELHVREAYVTDEDLICFDNSAPYLARDLSPTETPESACNYCNGASK